MTLKEYIAAKKRVVRAMLEKGKNTTEIADEFGVARQSMWQFIRRHNLDHGLTQLPKDPDEYYVNQRAKPALADDQEVRMLKTLATQYGVNM